MRRAVLDTPDYRRICAIPRREVRREHAEQYAAEMTRLLCLRPDKQVLWAWQGMGLAEAAVYGGGFFALPVGLGKTLLSYLLPIVLDAARPAVLCVPAGLHQKTLDDFGSYQRIWRRPAAPHYLVTYEELTQDGNETLLQQYCPDLLILDECDLLKNTGGSKWVRIARFLKDFPGTRVVAMTGTPGRKSILDYAHLLIAALGDGAPVPLPRAERELWAAALDETDRFTGGKRPSPGPLGPTRERAMAWFSNRLATTPGVLLVDEDSCDKRIVISQVFAPEDPQIDAHFETFRKQFRMPDGQEMTDPLAWQRHGSQLGTGMYLHWNPYPPEEWIEARKAYWKLIRAAIEKGISPTGKAMHTELQARRAYREHPAVQRWKEVAPTYTEQTEPVWVSGSVLHFAKRWLDENPRGLVWTGNVAFGEALATVSGLPFYGPKGLDLHGRYIGDHPAGRGAILSCMANLRGRNLQKWNTNLLINPPTSGKYLEQLFGRTHRAGQQEDVFVYFLLTSGETIDGFEAAVAEGAFGHRTYQLTAKILRAEITRLRPTAAQNPYRWANRYYSDDRS